MFFTKHAAIGSPSVTGTPSGDKSNADSEDSESRCAAPARSGFADIGRSGNPTVPVVCSVPLRANDTQLNGAAASSPAPRPGPGMRPATAAGGVLGPKEALAQLNGSPVFTFSSMPSRRS